MSEKLHYFVKYNNKIINTYNDCVCSKNDIFSYKTARLERKHNIVFFPNIIKDNLFYKYNVKQINDTIILTVYEGTYNGSIKWKDIYNVSATFGVQGIKEQGYCDLEFWHEYFSTQYGNSSKNEKDVDLYSITNNPMYIVRKVFNTHLEVNVFLFFENYKNTKKLFDKKYDINIFKDIPMPKINRNVGFISKNDEPVYFFWQREITINNEPFLDVVVMYGTVKNGIMDIIEKHRFFITENYAYSPDGGDLAILVNPELHGTFFYKDIAKHCPKLMIDKYEGKYFWAYFFSKNYIPAFEILAKAGFYQLADNLLECYHSYQPSFYSIVRSLYNDNCFEHINIFGKNDKEIFGFKLNKLNKLDFKITMLQDIFRIKRINFYNPNILNIKLTRNLFEFVVMRVLDNNLYKENENLRKIGSNNYLLYNDYLNMLHNCNVDYSLYPKNLKQDHDVLVEYTNQLKTERNNTIFKEIVSKKEYVDYCYDEDDNYCILAPRKSDDLINESLKLHHCVRTYIESVSKGKCKIFFMRLKKQKSTSLITIEVANNRIIQAKGKFNRKLDNHELSFLTKWADNKHLTLDLL